MTIDTQLIAPEEKIMTAQFEPGKKLWVEFKLYINLGYEQWHNGLSQGIQTYHI